MRILIELARHAGRLGNRSRRARLSGCAREIPTLARAARLDRRRPAAEKGGRDAALRLLAAPERKTGMKHLCLIGLLALGPLLAGCKAGPETARQRAIDACQDMKGSKGNYADCIR
jgi:hypothetical protein